MEKTYEVIVGAVGGKGKKIFVTGDQVTAENFPDGNAEKLVKAGFLKVVESSDDDQDSDDEIYKSITVPELKEDLTKREIAFPKNASKKDLYALWVK